MRKNTTKNIIALILLISFFEFYLDKNISASSSEVTIGIINGESLYLSNLERLFNAQKKKLYKDLNFNLFSPPVDNPKSTLKREDLIKKANKEGLFITNEEFESAWNELQTKEGGLANIEQKAKVNNLLISDIKLKLEETMLIERYFEKYAKEKLVDEVVNEKLLLQEVNRRNLQIADEEVTKNLTLIKESHGGEEGFKNFLAENNATEEDAKSEIKNQMLLDLLRKEFLQENINLRSFLIEKKKESNIIVYNDKIYTFGVTSEPNLRVNPYPTHSSLSKLFKNKKSTEEVPLLNAEQIKYVDSHITQIESSESRNLSKEFEELRKKIEQRQFANKEN